MVGMDDASIVCLSKRMSKALRHQPERIGLRLDAAGWVDVEDLLRALSTPERPVTHEMLDEVVLRNDKRRFALDDTGTRIRASQGHSVQVDLGLTPLPPPDVLFHGTVDRFLDAIRREGLRPMLRHHVHLSADHETAMRVGARRGRPVVLSVDAAGLAATGQPFHCSANGVWLVAHVPPEYLAEAG
jgi:putative RNA 2'-phosphotransferase